jgi:hypothetical protein
LDIVEGIYAKENRFLSFNVIILTRSVLKSTSSPIHGFLKVFCIDHQHIDLLIDDDFKKHLFESITIFKECFTFDNEFIWNRIL